MLRDFQRDLVNQTNDAWNAGARNVCLVSPTGSGKTVMLSAIIREQAVPTIAIAHRQELVGQLSLALNREGIAHGLICPDAVKAQIVSAHMAVHERSCYSDNAPVRVASVHSLPNFKRTDWLRTVRLAVVDEGHHVLRDNTWGKALERLPNARGLFPTAHAIRADGRGLGRHADGLVDALVVGPSCRDLINQGLLTDYRLFAPPSDLHLEDVPVTATGDYSPPKLRDAVHKSPTIVGDVVAHYLKFAAGKLGITFVVDVQSANETARAYQAAGVPAEVITADTPLNIRAGLMRQFRDRRILQLVSVDVLGEGVDVPAIEVVSLARPTQSFQLFAQQTGRALRLMISPFLTEIWNDLPATERLAHIAASVKPRALIIDHVNNWQRHGLPDVPQTYSLNRRDRAARKGPSDAIPLRACLQCLQPYLAVLPACPYCNAPRPAPKQRSAPDQVDGDLQELDPAALAQLRGEIARVDGPVRVPQNADAAVAGAITRRHRERQDAQGTLRAAMALWGGWQAHQGRGISEGQRRFWHAFGVDVATAQTWGATDANELEQRIRANLRDNNVIGVSNAE